jgi:hypothetical protein
MRRIHLRGTGISPLHQDLLKKAGREVLTGEARGAVEAVEALHLGSPTARERET